MVDPKFLEGAAIDFGQDHARMGLGALQLRKLSHRKLRERIGDGRDRKGDENLVEVESGVMAAEVIDLEIANRLDDGFREKKDVIGDAREILQSVEDHRARGAEKV